MRKRRKGLKMMEKPITSKYRTHFWYIALACFVIWLFLLYLFNSSSVITLYKEERLFREDNNFTVSVRESDEIALPLSLNENVDEANKSALSVNVDPIGQEKGDPREDVSVISDIVEELEKEKENEKKAAREETGSESENGILGKGSARKRPRKWPKIRSSDGGFPEKKKKNDQALSDNEKERPAEKAREWPKIQSLDNRFSEKKNDQELLNKERKSGDDDDDRDFFSEKQTGLDGEKQVFEGDLDAKKDKEWSEIRSLDRKENQETLNSEESLNNNEVIVTKRKRKRGRRNRGRRQPVDLPKPVENKIEKVAPKTRKVKRNDPCTGRYVYVHDIPALFNDELLKNCWSLSWWTDMCELTSNLGLGPHLADMEGVSSWFGTNQFTLEVIFHNRMKQYRCLTKDSSLASAIFVPYYAGLDVMRFLWGPFPYMRDAAALDLMKWLREKPEWKKMNGRDHFMVAGRTTWDFMRTPENESDWGNRLMILPETRNMTMLLIESSPWNYHGFAIPYPTYFHPSSEDEILQWQYRMRKIRRRYLFSFVGAPRPNLGDSIRGELMDQCKASRRKCKLLECISGSNKCYKPDQIMKFFLSSTFCLQPPGDSYTRRSTFDSILAGCIPVFFHPGSAYAQYIWHLPKDFTTFSVFIPAKDVKEGKVSIERILSRIPKLKVNAMREEVIRLIPKVMYANPDSRLERSEDAFDLTLKGVLERVEGMRKKIKEGKENQMFDFPEEFSWKYNMYGNVDRHEWDEYFERS